MTLRIRTQGVEALPAFIALAEDAAAWLWARGIRQWKPGGVRARHAEMTRKLAQGWLVTAVVPGDGGEEIVAGCLLTRIVPPEWQGRDQGRAAGAAYVERLTVARDCAGRGLPKTILDACDDTARKAELAVLRLDCWAGNETLRALYKGHGFCEVAELQSEGHRVCLFERRVGRFASGC